MTGLDPLGLAAFADQILGSITAYGPYAVVALFLILGFYGLVFRR